MKRLLAVALCVLMLTALTACSPTPSQNNGEIPPMSELQSIPEPKDATGSAFIGTWKVSAKKSIIDKITFLEDGSLQVFFNTSTLGGVFFDDGTKISICVSQSTIEGTYTVDGDVITILTEDDVLVLTKA